MNQTQKPSPYMDPIVTRSASTKGVVQQDAIEKKARRLVKFASEVVLVQKSGVKLEGSSSLGIDRNGNKTDLGLLTTDDLGRTRPRGSVVRRSTMACSRDNPRVKPNAFRFTENTSYMTPMTGNVCSEIDGVGAAQDVGIGSHNPSLITPSPVGLPFTSSNKNNTKQFQRHPPPPRPLLQPSLASRNPDRLGSSPDKPVGLDGPSIGQAQKAQYPLNSKAVQKQKVDGTSVLERCKTYSSKMLDKRPPPRPCRPPNKPPAMSSRKPPPHPDLKAPSTCNEKDGSTSRSPPVPLSSVKEKNSLAQPLQRRGHEGGKPAVPIPSPKPKETLPSATPKLLGGSQIVKHKSNTCALPNKPLLGEKTLHAEKRIPAEKLLGKSCSSRLPANQPCPTRPVPSLPTNSNMSPHAQRKQSKASSVLIRSKSPITSRDTNLPKINRSPSSPSSLNTAFRGTLSISSPVLKSTTFNMSLSQPIHLASAQLNQLSSTCEAPFSNNGSEAIYEELDLELNLPENWINDMGIEKKPALPPDRLGKGYTVLNAAVVSPSGSVGRVDSTQGQGKCEKMYEEMDMDSGDDYIDMQGDLTASFSDGEEAYVDMRPKPKEGEDVMYTEMNPVEIEMNPEEYSIPISGVPLPVSPSSQVGLFSAPTVPPPIYEYGDPLLTVKNEASI